MALSRPLPAHDVGASFADLVRDDVTVLRLWVRPSQDCLELWVLTSPIDAGGERRIHASFVELLERIPDVNVRIIVLNPTFFDEPDLATLVPFGAEEIPPLSMVLSMVLSAVSSTVRMAPPLDYSARWSSANATIWAAQ